VSFTYVLRLVNYYDPVQGPSTIMRTVVLVNSALSMFGGAISVASVARAGWTAPGSVNHGNQFPKFGEHVCIRGKIDTARSSI
jgi:hypothetical protein